MGAALLLKDCLGLETHQEKLRPHLRLVVGGAFLQKDPHPAQLERPITVVNAYAYAGNSPSIYKDPSGDFFGIDDLIIGLIILGGVIQAGFNMNGAQKAGFGSDTSQFWLSGLLGLTTGSLGTASGIFGGPIGAIGGAAVFNSLNNIGNQGIFTNKVDWQQAGSAFVGGALSGAASVATFEVANYWIMPNSPVIGQSVGYWGTPVTANYLSFTTGVPAAYFLSPSGIPTSCSNPPPGQSCTTPSLVFGQ